MPSPTATYSLSGEMARHVGIWRASRGRRLAWLARPLSWRTRSMVPCVELATTAKPKGADWQTRSTYVIMGEDYSEDFVALHNVSNMNNPFALHLRQEIPKINSSPAKGV